MHDMRNLDEAHVPFSITCTPGFSLRRPWHSCRRGHECTSRHRFTSLLAVAFAARPACLLLHHTLALFYGVLPYRELLDVPPRSGCGRRRNATEKAPAFLWQGRGSRTTRGSEGYAHTGNISRRKLGRPHPITRRLAKAANQSSANSNRSSSTIGVPFSMDHGFAAGWRFRAPAGGAQ
jgi:hypothetical protein